MTIRAFGKESAKYAGCFCSSCYTRLDALAKDRVTRTILPQLPYGQGDSVEIYKAATNHDEREKNHEIIVWRFDDEHPINLRVVNLLRKYKVPGKRFDFSRNND